MGESRVVMSDQGRGLMSDPGGVGGGDEMGGGDV